jgi:hypothetical protein
MRPCGVAARQRGPKGESRIVYQTVWDMVSLLLVAASLAG